MKTHLAVFLISLFLLTSCAPLVKKEASPIDASQATLPSKEGQTNEDTDSLTYIPASLNRNVKNPIVFVFTPDEQRDNYLKFWKPLAEQKGFVVVVSKIFKNGTYTDQELEQIKANSKSLIIRSLNTLPVSPRKIIFTGLSGGGSFSHAMNIAYPGLADVLIVNTGRMWDPEYDKASNDWKSLSGKFANAKKLVVFLASPTDFRYAEMKRDRLAMQKLGWKTEWLEFDGGHRMAPVDTYEKALAVALSGL